jgi:hypothetical protein
MFNMLRPPGLALLADRLKSHLDKPKLFSKKGCVENYAAFLLKKMENWEL